MQLLGFLIHCRNCHREFTLAETNSGGGVIWAKCTECGHEDILKMQDGMALAAED